MSPQPKALPVRSSAYLKWIRSQPCQWCGHRAPSEATHHGKHGVATKPCDLSAVSGCTTCHRLWHSSLNRNNVGRLVARWRMHLPGPTTPAPQVTAGGIRSWAETVATDLRARYVAHGGRF